MFSTNFGNIGCDPDAIQNRNRPFLWTRKTFLSNSIFYAHKIQWFKKSITHYYFISIILIGTETIQIEKFSTEWKTVQAKN